MLMHAGIVAALAYSHDALPGIEESAATSSARTTPGNNRNIKHSGSAVATLFRSIRLISTVLKKKHSPLSHDKYAEYRHHTGTVLRNLIRTSDILIANRQSMISITSALRSDRLIGFAANETASCTLPTAMRRHGSRPEGLYLDFGASGAAGED
jgi:hypothetical protein